MSATGSNDRIHELLPWYVAGTLGPEETEAFRSHLTGCESCRGEMGTLEQVRDRVEQYGAEFFEDHPAAEQIVAALAGELDDDASAAVQRHLHLCAACSAEAGWIRGESAAYAEPLPAIAPARPATTRGWLPWLAAAAGIIVGLLLPFGNGDAPGTRIVRSYYVSPTVRADDPANVFEIEAGQSEIQLLFDIDFPPSAFPLSLAVLDADGNVVHRETGVTRDVVFRGTTLFLNCSTRVCVPGDYTLRVEGSAEDEPAAELRFQLDQR